MNETTAVIARRSGVFVSVPGWRITKRTIWINDKPAESALLQTLDDAPEP